MLTLNEGLTLLVLIVQSGLIAGQLFVYHKQRELMARQLRVITDSEAREQRHDRLSVRPLLDVTSYFDGRKMQIKLSNEGLGIALIRRVQLLVDEVPVSSDDPSVVPAATVLYALGFEQSHLVGVASAFFLARDSALRPGGVISVIDIGLDGTYQYSHMQRLRLIAEYASLYDEPFTLNWQVGTQL